MAEYLTADQKAEFIRQLESQSGNSDGGTAGALTPEEQQQAMQQGAQMAAADAQANAAGGDTPAVQQSPAGEAQNQSVDAQTLSQLGFSSVDELANAYRETLHSQTKLKEMLIQLTALEQAQQNEQQLDESTPEGKMRSMMRKEFAPMYDKMKADARNQVVQEAWKRSADGKADLSELMPEIQAYITGKPELAMAEDGLERAYHAVRSGKYRNEDALFSDPEFVKKAAGNEQIRKTVIEAYLQNIARNGEVVPQSITDGGSTPLTGKKTISGMEHAKNMLASMLGAK